ncbi:MAG: translation initiation factor IF-2 subunit beta, partial [Halobacteriales archaeon]|nr:translation initiation factor IF-2 subunit beta [Halobacteriales archaeon]
MDYDSMLDRGLEDLPEINASDRRLSLPDPEVQPDGAFTRLTNLGAIADALARPPEHLHSGIQGELATNGQLKDGRARYNGRFTSDDLLAAVEEYVAEYVTCSECGLPDTRLVQEDRTQMLRCDACGAFRPVAKRTAPRASADRPTLEEGNSYEVKITGTGRKGDGVAEMGRYTIFVPG